MQSPSRVDSVDEYNWMVAAGPGLDESQGVLMDRKRKNAADVHVLSLGRSGAWDLATCA